MSLLRGGFSREVRGCLSPGSLDPQAWEREIMLERQREGIAKAKAEGKYKGRPAAIDAHEVKRVARLIGPAATAKQLGIARSTVYRLMADAA